MYIYVMHVCACTFTSTNNKLILDMHCVLITYISNVWFQCGDVSRGTELVHSFSLSTCTITKISLLTKEEING